MHILHAKKPCSPRRQAKFYAMRLALGALLTAFLCYSVFYGFEKWSAFLRPIKTNTDANAVKIILDAGHGGMDGGAVSVTGTLEKDLNLSLTLQLADFLRAAGFDVILTRDTDTMLSTADGGKRKMQDLRARLDIANANPGAIFVSIHMNIFSVEKYAGLQVYYSQNQPESKRLADTVQNFTKLHLQPENDRLTKPATSSIFLMDRMQSTGVLVECGFLSNQAEAEKLDTPAYRKQLAFLLSAAITEFCNTVPTGNGI